MGDEAWGVAILILLPIIVITAVLWITTTIAAIPAVGSVALLVYMGVPVWLAVTVAFIAFCVILSVIDERRKANQKNQDRS